MANELLIDNWSLQDVGCLLKNGISHDERIELYINRTSNSHSLEKIPLALIQLEALIDFLNNIIFREQMIVDDRFVSGWFDDNPILSSLSEKGLIRSFPFLDDPESLVNPRKSILKELCVTKSLQDYQKNNERFWYENQKDKFDKNFSAIVWGGAGMLARSHVLRCPYIAHPLRQRLFDNTMFLNSYSDAASEVLYVINSERAKFYRTIRKGNISHYGIFSLPPAVVELINNISDINSLIPVALQLREKYSDLREWIRKYQLAIDCEDNNSIIKHRRIIDSVTKNMEEKYSDTKNDRTSMKIGYSFFNITLKGNLINKLNNYFGVRSTLNKLILQKRGKQSFEKLLELFGERNSILKIDVMDKLVQNKNYNPNISIE